MKSVSLVIIVLALLCSCGSSSSKMETYAADMCGCFEAEQKKLDVESIAMLEKVRNSPTPQLTLQLELPKLAPEKIKTVTEVFQSIGDKNAPTSKCLEGFDKRHAYSKSTDRKQMALDIAEKMKEHKSCILGSTVIYMGAKSSN
jgi:hypothetical protein